MNELPEIHEVLWIEEADSFEGRRPFEAQPQLLPPEGEGTGQQGEVENLELTCEGSSEAAQLEPE